MIGCFNRADVFFARLKYCVCLMGNRCFVRDCLLFRWGGFPRLIGSILCRNIISMVNFFILCIWKFSVLFWKISAWIFNEYKQDVGNVIVQILFKYVLKCNMYHFHCKIHHDDSLYPFPFNYLVLYHRPVVLNRCTAKEFVKVEKPAKW